MDPVRNRDHLDGMGRRHAQEAVRRALLNVFLGQNSEKICANVYGRRFEEIPNSGPPAGFRTSREYPDDPSEFLILIDTTRVSSVRSGPASPTTYSTCRTGARTDTRGIDPGHAVEGGILVSLDHGGDPGDPARSQTGEKGVTPRALLSPFRASYVSGTGSVRRSSGRVSRSAPGCRRIRSWSAS